MRCLNIDILILLGILLRLLFVFEFWGFFKFGEVIFFILLELIFGFFRFVGVGVKLFLFKFFGSVILIISY